MREEYASVNGRLKPLPEARISVADRGVLYGDGIYETIRVRNGRCVRLDHHLDRLRRGLRTLHLGEAAAAMDFESAISALLEANQMRDARVRLTVTRGESAGAGKLVQECTEPTVIVTTHPLPEPPRQPVNLITSSFRRDETSPLCGVKSLNCLPSVLARFEAAEQGADDAIMLNTRGLVAEATTSNLFIVAGNRLLTPSLDQGALPGTTRHALIGLAPTLGLQVVEKGLSVREVMEADEVFLTSAIQLVRQIGRVDGRVIGESHEASTRVLEALLRA